MQVEPITRVSTNLVWLIAALLFFIAMLLTVAVGAVAIPFFDVITALFSGDVNSSADLSTQTQLIVWQIRLPRALLAMCVGSMLAISGAAMQGMFRNPLADPSLIGVTAGAVAGASVMIVFGGSLLSAMALYNGAASSIVQELGQLSLVSAGAFIGGSLSVWLVYRLATSSLGTSVSTMLLAGIAITALAGSLTSLLEFSASNDMLRRISLWRMGGLDGANYTRVAIAAVVSSLLLVCLPRYGRDLNVMLLGESEARHLGVNVEKVKLHLVLLAAAGVAVSVALAGSIAFVGLVVPHIIRLLVGPDHQKLLPLSAIAGAILLLFADSLSRTLIAPAELPVGVITSILGAPFFIMLLRHRHEYGMR